MRNKGKRSLALYITLFFALAAVGAIAAVTYAWFSYRNYTNVTPLSGTVSGEEDLLISNSRDGSFSTSCELLTDNRPGELLPVTTAQLARFYTAKRQDSNGIAREYAGVDAISAGSLIHGRVYLKNTGKPLRIYFWQDALGFGSDVQALAAMRLGLIMHTNNGAETHIFRLDDMADTRSARSRNTVERPGSVVSNIEGMRPIYASDPASRISDYSAVGSETAPAAGREELCILEQGETAEVEFFLYLEGCDEHCIDVVQARDAALALRFAGVPM